VSLPKMHNPFEAENERLKDEFQKAKEWNQFSEIQIKNLQNIVEAQNELLSRAADALEDLKGPGWKRELIAELREAAG
jgi:hypothetical protein